MHYLRSVQSPTIWNICYCFSLDSSGSLALQERLYLRLNGILKCKQHMEHLAIDRCKEFIKKYCKARELRKNIFLWYDWSNSSWYLYKVIQIAISSPLTTLLEVNYHTACFPSFSSWKIGLWGNICYCVWYDNTCDHSLNSLLCKH